MSTVLVLAAVVAFGGCSDTASGPRPPDAQRAEDPGVEDPANPDPTSDQVQGNDSDNDEGDGEEHTASGNHPLDPTQLRTRWNELVGATDDGSVETRFLAMGELQPGDDGTTVGAALSDGAGSGEAAATVTATLSADGTPTTITINLIHHPNATQTERMFTELTLPRLLLASTLPSRPALNDPAVTEPAEALSLHGPQHATGTVVAEGITYATRIDDEGWTLVARIDP